MLYNYRNSFCNNHRNHFTFCLWMVTEQFHTGTFLSCEWIYLGTYEAALFPHAYIFLFHGKKTERRLPLYYFIPPRRGFAWDISDPGNFLHLLRYPWTAFHSSWYLHIHPEYLAGLCHSLQAFSVLPRIFLHVSVKNMHLAPCLLLYDFLLSASWPWYFYESAHRKKLYTILRIKFHRSHHFYKKPNSFLCFIKFFKGSIISKNLCNI